MATEIASEAYDAQTDVDDFVDQAEHKIFQISERRIRPSFHTMPELTRESLKVVERLYENASWSPASPPALPTSTGSPPASSPPT